MNEPTERALASTPTSGHLLLPGVWALAEGEEVALGGRIARLLARWLDLSSTTGALLVLSVALSTERALPTVLGCILCGGFVLAQVLGVALWGRTLGKLVFGLKIVHRSGRRIGALRGLVLREGVRVFAEFTGILILLDVALIFRDDRRTLHDLLSGSIVIHQPADWRRLRDALTRR